MNLNFSLEPGPAISAAKALLARPHPRRGERARKIKILAGLVRAYDKLDKDTRAADRDARMTRLEAHAEHLTNRILVDEETTPPPSTGLWRMAAATAIALVLAPVVMRGCAA